MYDLRASVTPDAIGGWDGEERTMKTLVTALGAILLVTFSSPAGAQGCMSYRLPTYYGGAYAAPAYGYPYTYAPPAYGYPGYTGYPVYPYYPYPLPPAPSFGFGRGGIYGHAFIGR